MIWLLSLALILGAFALGVTAGWLFRGDRERGALEDLAQWMIARFFAAGAIEIGLRHIDDCNRRAEIAEWMREDEERFRAVFGEPRWNVVSLRPRSDRGLLGLDVPRGAS